MITQTTKQADRFYRLRWVTLGATSLALFMALLDNMIVVTALPTIARELDASQSQQQWILNAYILVFGILLVSFGKLGDQYGRRRLFLVGVVLFVGGSLLCSVAPSAEALIAFRVLQALGPAFIFPLTLAIISETFEAKERAIAIAVWGTLAGASIALGPLVGGFLTDHVSWRAVFWINAPIGLAVVGITLLSTRESRDSGMSKTIDWWGNLLIALSLFALLFALTKTDSSGWNWGAPKNVGLLTVSFVLGFAFAVNEWWLESRGGEPLVSPILFRNPTYVAANLAALAISFGMFAVILFNTLYLQNALGHSAFATGLRMLVFAGPLMVASPCAAAVAERVGTRWPLTLGFALASLGMILFADRVAGGAEFAHYWWTLSLVGVGAGLIFPSIGTAVIGTFSPAKTGLVSGINDMCREVGGALGIAVAGAIFLPAFEADLSSRISQSGLSPDVAQAIVVGANRGSIAPADLSQEVMDFLQISLRHAYSNGLIDILQVSALILGAGAVVCFALARRRHMWTPRIEQGVGEQNE